MAGIGAKLSGKRGMRKDVRALDIANLLTKAGWQWRRGHGDHIVVYKDGERNIPLADPISMAQWKDIERTVGVEIENLITKQVKGRAIGEAEWRKRFTVALDLHRAGFGRMFTLRHAGLMAIYNKDHRLTPEIIEAEGAERAVERFIDLTAHRGARPRSAPPVAAAAPVVAAIEIPAVIEQQPVDDVTAIVELLQEMRADTRQLVLGRAERAIAYAERLRLLKRRLEALRSSIVERLDEVLGALAEF